MQLREGLSLFHGLPTNESRARSRRRMKGRRRKVRQPKMKGPLGYIRSTKRERQQELQRMARLMADTPKKQLQAAPGEYGGVIYLVGQDEDEIRRTLEERTRRLRKEGERQGKETTLRATDSKIGDAQLMAVGQTAPDLHHAFLSRCNHISDTGLRNFFHETRGQSLSGGTS